MADPVKEGTGKAATFLTRKLGPLPVWVWMAGGIGIYYYISRRNAANTSAAAANQQTDPAGNIGSIDPATGYVYGTPEDLAALASNNAGSTGGSTGGSATTGAQTYADNNAWGIAAINFLVGLGVDPVTANQAVQQYLNSAQLTAAQQADVNLALKALGPPPTLPAPTSGNPPPIVNPPGGGGGGGNPPPKGKTAAPPTGLTVASKTATTATLKWNKSGNASGYMVRVTDQGSKKVVQNNGTKALTATIGNLQAGHTYQADVFAQPGDTTSGPHAQVTFTLPTVAKLAGK